jgi:ABC-type Zn uptake system ZnuABC Zn-binding protein ZnuA
MSRNTLAILFTIFTLSAFALTACSNAASSQLIPEEGGEEGELAYKEAFLSSPSELSAVSLREGEKLSVIATTNIAADVVGIIGGEAIELVDLIPLGADPHTYQPTPGDYRAMADAHVVFINGFGLEESMHSTLEGIVEEVAIVSLSAGIEPRQVGVEDTNQHQGEDEGSDEVDDHHAEGLDPHVWFDPFNVMTWASNAAQVMGTLDPINAANYQENAREYIEALQELHTWIEGEVAVLPEGNRQLVTDHLTFGYFVGRYGFEMIGAVIPAYSTAAEPSARELASLEDAIRALEVKALFVGITVNPKLAERVAEDTGVILVPLFTGSLSEPEAGTYIEMMKFNVTAIVEALR